MHGRGDTPLAELGVRQARALGRRLAAERIAGVFHSPLSRAARTAEIIAESLAPRPFVRREAGLKEVDFGEIEGLTLAEVRERFPDFAYQWERGEVDRFPGGDDLAEFRKGAADAVERCLRSVPEGDVVIVAHKGIVRAALDRFTRGLEPRRFEIDLGSVSCLDRTGTGWVVALWNEVPPLDPA